MSFTSPHGCCQELTLKVRYDFYQTLAHLILSLYIKGYGGPEVKDRVLVSFEGRKVRFPTTYLWEPILIPSGRLLWSSRRSTRKDSSPLPHNE